MGLEVTTVIVFQHQEPCPYKMVNLIDECVSSDCSTDGSPPSLSLSLGLPIPWDTAMLNFCH